MTEISDALEDCLEAMARGASLDHALKRYPQLDSELRPLLRASLMARDAARINVPAEVRRRGRSQLIDQVRQGKGTQARGRMIPLFPRLALTAVFLAVLVLTSTGLVSASSTSLPGQQLYPVKRTWESVRLLFTFSSQQRDLMESGYEQERLDEISELLGRRISAPISFSGLLSRQVGGQWTISGIPVAVGATTTLPAAAVNDGEPVTVIGVTRPDGVVDAQQIQLLQPGVALPPLEPSEPHEQGDHESESDGHTVTPAPPPAATLPATQPQGAASQPSTYQFSGVVQSMQGNVWTINGQSVYLDAAQVDAQVTVGSSVRFHGYYGADGRFIVTSIELRSNDSGGKQDGSDKSGNDGESNDGGGDH